MILQHFYERARRAHYNTSFVPEKRAESIVRDYSEELQHDLSGMPEAADGIATLVKFQKGDIVRVSFNLRSNKTKEGRWMTNVVAWDVRLFVPQSTDDFQQPQTASEPVTSTPAATAPAIGDDLPF